MSWIVKTSTYSHHNSSLAVEIKVNSQSTTDNSTLLSYRVYADNTGYSTTWVKYHSGEVKINGTTVYSSNTSIAGYRNQTFKTGTIRIPHNSDGTKSINVSLSADIYSSSGNRKTGSETITLPRIDRGIYSVSLARGWNDITGSKSISYEKYNSSVRVSLNYSYWSRKDNSYSKEYLITSDYTSGNEFSFSESVIDDIHNDKPNLREATIKIILKVYMNNNLIETIIRYVDLKLKVESPTVGVSCKFTGKNQSIIGTDSKGLRDVHNLELTFDGTAYNGAKIDEYKIEYDGSTYRTKNSTFSIVPKIAGSRELKVTTFDSRNFLETVTLNVDVLPYEKPKINYSAHRAENGQENPIGDIAQVKGSISIFDVLGRNSAWWTISVNNQIVFSSGISYSFSLPIHEQREITISYGDKFTTAEVKTIIPVGYAPIVLGKESVGVNVVPPENGRGLYIKDGLINGYPIANVLYLYANHNTYGLGNIPEAVKQNWSKVPEGVSLAHLKVGSEGVAVIHKYTGQGDNYGSFISFGLSLESGRVRRFVLNNGKWKEESV